MATVLLRTMRVVPLSSVGKAYILFHDWLLSQPVKAFHETGALHQAHGEVPMRYSLGMLVVVTMVAYLELHTRDPLPMLMGRWLGL